MTEIKRKKGHIPIAERKTHIAAWRASRLSRIRYSQENGLSDKTFSRWVRELNDLPRSQPEKKALSIPISLLPVKTTQIKSPIATVNKDTGCLEINLPNGICIRSKNVEDMYRVTSIIKELLLCK